MFPFDHAALPQLTTRKALIGVDFQNDFVAEDGALLVSEPEGFVDRAVKLANTFRDVGDVVWIQSKFEAPRSHDDELIITSDAAALPKSRQSGRLKIPAELAGLVEPTGPPDPEAFLSHEVPTCVKPDTPGCGIALAIEEASQKSDVKLTKTNYSAFQSTHLLRLLRAKMVMEVFIMGSLTNVGVYATALDAAGHGMAITVVHDCCGFRSETRQSKAINKLIELTGCEIASYDEVIETIQPAPKPTKPVKEVKGKAPASTKRPEHSGIASTKDDDEELRRKSLTPEIVKNMTGLRLASDSPSPASRTQPQAKAPTTCPPEDINSTTEPPSNAEETNSAKTPSTDKIPTEKTDGIAALKDAVDVSKNNGEPQSHQSPSTDSPPTESTEHPAPESAPLEQPERETMAKSKAETRGDEGNLLQKGLCEGDTDIIQSVLPDDLADGIFDKLREEVQWQRMSHQGGEVPRLVAVQGQVAEDGSIPVYRHPSDESPPLLPFSPTVLAIKAETEKHLGHPLNHVLIQFYRDGSDYISEHSDKTLDIVQSSYIANVSLGAERIMVFRTKRLDKDPSRTAPPPTDSKRQIQRAKLPHNSLCRLGLKSNKKWLHAIRQDKRAEREKSAAELAYNGGRISLTFRQIGTFLNREETLIWGQGATGKMREEAHSIINGQSPEAIEMLKAFGTENHATEFDWDAYYGNGFDVLHMSNAPRLFSSADSIVNSRIALMLSEFGVKYAKGSMGAATSSKDDADSVAIKFVDKDKSTVQGDIAIMLYLDARYGAGKPGATPRTPLELATQFTRFQQGLAFLDKWRHLAQDENTEKRHLKPLKQELATWDGLVAESEGDFITGSKLSLPDFAFWPALHALVDESGIDALDSYANLRKYYETVSERPSAKKVTGRETKPHEE
ncbi:hypothetical protein B0T10DRAFT_528 [Thelonectria olida]|uniref:Uncharacterized protein n=1 Tax=Thelonectria olida TaxID=1576542 RepID=A0A9P8WHJ9_9HYPO|nr:hypothetical protein B0T10DRAFT_528 [Thelonectria olida]